MRYRSLGKSGLMVSVVGLGCNNLGRDRTRTADLDGSRAVVEAALDAGITLFDTADVYGSTPGRSEELLGKSLGTRRDEVVIATKFGVNMGGHDPAGQHDARGSRRYLRRAVEASLRRLGTDYIDLYQYHARDRITPIEETLAALAELVTEGKVRYIGSSNFTAWHVVEAQYLAPTAGGVRFISAQNYYNLLRRDAEAELLPACEAYGIGVLPYFPLASGLLTGKYRRDEAPRPGTRIGDIRPGLHAEANWDVLDGLRAYAAERDRTMLDVAIGGLAAQRSVTSVIAGATSPEQVRANATAGDWEPTASDLAELDTIAPPPPPPR